MYKLVWQAVLLKRNPDADNDQLAQFNNAIDFDHQVLASKVAEAVGDQMFQKLVQFFAPPVTEPEQASPNNSANNEVVDALKAHLDKETTESV